jgi:hypothetical protein
MIAGDMNVEYIFTLVPNPCQLIRKRKRKKKKKKKVALAPKSKANTFSR